MGKLELWPILFFHYKIDDWQNKKKYFLELKNRSSMSKDPYDNLLTDYSGKKIPYANEVQATLQNELNLFKKDININRNIKIDDAWFQQYNRSMNQGVHTHGAYGYSAVVYVQFDPNYHPSTSFFPEHLCFLEGAVQCFEPKVNEGDLILFPSNLKHYAQPNTTNYEKIILSFNLKWID